VVAGDRLEAAGRGAPARRVYEHGAEVRPAAVLLERLAALDAADGRPERTTRTLERLRRLHPRDASLLGALVRRLLAENALDAAETALASWSADTPVLPVLEALRGECCRRRGQHEQAAEHLARVAAEHLAPRAFRCRACGEPEPAWRPRCRTCGHWDTIASGFEAHEDDSSVDLIRSPRRSTVANHCVTESPG
jgi:lipopolysaccharide biosynthesis regulator YciM